MKKTILTTVAALSVLCTFAQWKPVGDKIKTPWAEKVDPANVLPEYPRPQMVRSQWVNLNGLWDYAVEDGDDHTRRNTGKILVPFAPESLLSGCGFQLRIVCLYLPEDGFCGGLCVDRKGASCTDINS